MERRYVRQHPFVSGWCLLVVVVVVVNKSNRNSYGSSRNSISSVCVCVCVCGCCYTHSHANLLSLSLLSPLFSVLPSSLLPSLNLPLYASQSGVQMSNFGHGKMYR